jgi:hypothetical protein
MDTNRNNSGLETGSTGYNPGRDTGQNVRQGPTDVGPGRGAEGGGGLGSPSLQKPVQAAKQFVNEGKRVAKDIGQEVGHHAKDIAQEIAGSADEYIEQGRERVTGQVGSLANALHRVSAELRNEQDGAQVARVTDLIAERLDSAASMLQNKEPRDIIRGIENFARREPALFLGGCLLAGVVISRFLKASTHRGEGDSSDWAGGNSWGGRDSSGNFGSSAPMDVNSPRGPLDRSGLGGSAAPFDVTPRTPETPPDLKGGV